MTSKIKYAHSLFHKPQIIKKGHTTELRSSQACFSSCRQGSKNKKREDQNAYWDKGNVTRNSKYPHTGRKNTSIWEPQGTMDMTKTKNRQGNKGRELVP